MTDTSDGFGSTAITGPNKAVWTWEDWRYYETDDKDEKAWKTGFQHAYRGINGSWMDDETMDMYELGLQDGAAECERTIARGEKDPRDFAKRAGYARKN